MLTEETENARPSADTLTPDGPPAATDEVPETPGDLTEYLTRLERVLRGIARDGLNVTRAQRDAQTALQTILLRLDDLELTNKGMSQAVWRAAQESQTHIQSAEQHFAGAIRELETRVRGELRWQLYQSALQAIFPALDDMDLVIGNQRSLAGGSVQDDDLLKAIMLVRQKFAEGLRMLGLEEIPIEEGVTLFDSDTHHQIESDVPRDLLDGSDLPIGTIVRVRRVGYRLDGRVFRVPQVLVKS
jgi:molecular chaperone GrpE (heat shock protein)